MKLKTKITLTSVCLLLLLSQAFSIWNLSRTQEQIIENIRSYEYDRLSSDVWRFTISAAQSMLPGPHSPPATVKMPSSTMTMKNCTISVPICST